MAKKIAKKKTVKPTGSREMMMLWDINQKIDDVTRRLDMVTRLVKQIQQTEAKIMATADDVLSKIAELDTVEDSVLQLCTSLHDMLQQAKTDPAKLDQAIQLLDQQKQKIADSVTANTDAA